MNKLFNKKNDNYYTASNDTSILNEKPIVNDKQNDKQSRRLYNVLLTKFMLIIAILILLACAFCYNSGLAHIMCPIVLGLLLLIFIVVLYSVL